jgi:hypothetical protein
VAEVVFVLDGSDSISDFEFLQQIQLVEKYVNAVEINQEQVRLGLVVFSSRIGDVHGLSSFNDSVSVLHVLSNISHPKDGSRTELGIRRMEEMLRMEGRTGEPFIGVVFSDGRSKYPHATRGEGKALHSSGVHLIAIGVGRDIQHGELMAIASSPQDVTSVRAESEALSRILRATNLLGKGWCLGTCQASMCSLLCAELYAYCVNPEHCSCLLGLPDSVHQGYCLLKRCLECV